MYYDKKTLVGLELTDPEVPTPSFVIDKTKLLHNIARAKARAHQLGVTFRPHVKTHKAIEIARLQMETPEGPATVSTLAEARYLAQNGVKDIIYAVGIAPQKLPEVVAIRHLGCDLKIILDSVEAAKLVSAFCKTHGVSIPVLLEIDVDGHRSGLVPEDAEIVQTAKALTDGATLAGVLTHAGDSYECKTDDAIVKAAEAERAGIVKAADTLRSAGFTVDIVSVGSSPTLMHAKSEAGVTEIRAGVCALFDLFMHNVGIAEISDIAGSVLTTIIGRKADKGRVITDSGFLAMSRDRGTQRQKVDYGYGLICDVDGKPLEKENLLLTGTNQEHGIITLLENGTLTQKDFPIGRRLRILPNHACATAAPHSHLLIVENGKIVDVLSHVRAWELD